MSIENDAGVPVPRDSLIHLEVAYDVAACERNGRDWSGSGDFYLTSADSPRARFINCPECLIAREAVEHFPEPCAVGGHGPVWCAVCMQKWPCKDAARA